MIMVTDYSTKEYWLMPGDQFFFEDDGYSKYFLNIFEYPTTSAGSSQV